MGICASCLGLNRRPSRSDDPSDTTQLLTDAYQPHYGALSANGGPHAGVPQPDPEEIRRQRDALERLCAQTSDKLIDVTQAATLTTTASANADEGATASETKMTREFARLFTQRFVYGRPPASRSSSINSMGEGQDEAGWLARMVDSEEDGGEGVGDEVGEAEGKGREGALSVPSEEALDTRR